MTKVNVCESDKVRLLSDLLQRLLDPTVHEHIAVRRTLEALEAKREEMTPEELEGLWTTSWTSTFWRCHGVEWRRGAKLGRRRGRVALSQSRVYTSLSADASSPQPAMRSLPSDEGAPPAVLPSLPPSQSSSSLTLREKMARLILARLYRGFRPDSKRKQRKPS